MLDKILAGKCNVNALNIGHLQINSKCCSICYRLAVIWRTSFEIPNFGGLWDVRGVRIWTNRKTTHDFAILLNTKFCSIWCRLDGMSMSNYDPPFGELGWTQGVENDTNQNVNPRFLCDFYTHYRPIMHFLAILHNAADDYRAIGIGRLCCGISGLIIRNY